MKRANTKKNPSIPSDTMETQTFTEPVTVGSFEPQPVYPDEKIESKHHVNEPENGCYGEIKLFCGRATKECNFRGFIDSSPSGLIHGCLRCKDLRIKIDTKSKM